MKNAGVKRFKRGFTLAEMLTVVAILAILASIVAPVTLQYIEQTREKADQVYTSDIAKMADSCVISLKNRSVPINSQSVSNELRALYGTDIPYDIGYIQTGRIGGPAAQPSFENVEGIIEGVSSYVVIFIVGRALNVYLITDEVAGGDQRPTRLNTA